MKHLKKDTGGYALLYVLVIVMVLVAISMMICTVALRNLQSQQAAVERMANKYAAQGEIEKIKAIIEEGISGEYDNPAKEYLEAIAERMTTEITFSPTSDDVTAREPKIVASIKSAEDDVLVSAEVTINLTYDTHRYTDDAGNVTETKYSINSISTSFTSYAIETTGGDAG